IDGGEFADRAGDIVGVLLQVGELGLAQRFLELALEFVGHAADLAHPLAKRAQYGWQLLRPDRDQRDDADDDHLAPTKSEHGLINSLRMIPKSGPGFRTRSCAKQNANSAAAADCCL